VACQRYRLFLNGSDVSVGDTPWEANAAPLRLAHVVGVDNIYSEYCAPPISVRRHPAFPRACRTEKASGIVVSGFRKEDLDSTADMIPKANSAMRFRFHGQMVAVEEGRRPL